MRIKNKNVLITAGPTREYIDPVRYISNGSSGKMGYALANEAKKRRADVILISGPTNIPQPKNIKFINVVSALEMFKEVKKYFKKCDIFISCAAVCDYRPENFAAKKIKKTGRAISLKLVPNPDILLLLSKSLSRRVAKPPIIVGFALETDNLVRNALLKLKKKNLEMIVANKPEAMESDETSGALITPKGIKHFSKISKKRLAGIILDEISALQ